MEYLELQGDFLDAYSMVSTGGGQLYCGDGKDTANVVVRGNKCYTFWRNDSLMRTKVRELAVSFGFNPDGMTGGRIARRMLKEIVGLDTSGTYWHKTYRDLAKDGSHWHYMHCDNKKTFWGVELDLKSAYFSSYLSFPSMLYSPSVQYIDDGGAMDNLRELYQHFPKWYRLQVLGMMASWRTFYYCRDKKNPERVDLVQRHRYNISYGAAFNTVHRAILRNYKIMQRIHKIGGSHIRRMHTDSFFLDADTPQSVANNIKGYLQDKGVSVSCKGYGKCYFWDINTGFIGKRIVGSPPLVIQSMREDGIKMAKPEVNDGYAQIFSDFTDNI